MAEGGKVKMRKYSNDYLKLGFIAAPHDARLPFCLLCEQTLCNDSMKPAKMELHLNTKHKEHAKKNLRYFSDLKMKREQQPKINSLFRMKAKNLDRGTEASYQISLLIAKKGKPHTIGEELIKPALAIFARTVLKQTDESVQTVTQ